MQTRKYPRTMQEAFGPYCSRSIEPMKSSRPKLLTADNITTLISAVVAIGLVVSIAMGWLK